jgi:hypothetical protein
MCRRPSWLHFSLFHAFTRLFDMYFWVYLVAAFHFADWGKFANCLAAVLAAWWGLAAVMTKRQDRWLEHNPMMTLHDYEDVKWSMALPRSLFYILALSEWVRTCLYKKGGSHSVYILTALLLALEEFGLDWIGVGNDSSVHFTLYFVVQNEFVFIMAYFHWPWKLASQAAGKDVHGDDGFFPEVDENRQQL